jgi:hypothetical protein
MLYLFIAYFVLALLTVSSLIPAAKRPLPSVGTIICFALLPPVAWAWVSSSRWTTPRRLWDWALSCIVSLYLLTCFTGLMGAAIRLHGASQIAALVAYWFCVPAGLIISRVCRRECEETGQREG